MTTVTSDATITETETGTDAAPTTTETGMGDESDDTTMSTETGHANSGRRVGGRPGGRGRRPRAGRDTAAEGA